MASPHTRLRSADVRPKVSVCVATYNGAQYIEQQLRSVLQEIGRFDEVVVSDDGSTDGTKGLVRSLADSRIRILDGDPVRSPAFNFERALQASSGDLIFLCDQDDVWLPGRVDRVIPVHKTQDVVVVDSQLVDHDGDVLVESVFDRWGGRQGFFRNLYRNRYIGCCMSVRREVLDLALPFPKSIPMHDSWIGLIGEAYGTTCFYPERLVRYRQHDGNASPAGRSSPNSRRVQVAQRAQLVWHVAARLITRRASTAV